MLTEINAARNNCIEKRTLLCIQQNLTLWTRQQWNISLKIDSYTSIAVGCLLKMPLFGHLVNVVLYSD